MGICMTVRALSDDKIRAILEEPPLVWRIVAPENPELYLEESGQAGRPGFLARLLGAQRKRPPRVPDFVFSEAEAHEVDLDKSWDGLNFCIGRLVGRGDCPNLFEDGAEVGDVEIGYGAAMCFGSAEVARIAERYAAISEADLLAEYAPAEMEGVYPGALWVRGDEECRAYLADSFAALKEFLLNVKREGVGILIQFT